MFLAPNLFPLFSPEHSKEHMDSTTYLFFNYHLKGLHLSFGGNPKLSIFPVFLSHYNDDSVVLIFHDFVVGSKDEARYKNLANWSCAIGYGLGSGSPLSPSFNFGLELAKNSQV